MSSKHTNTYWVFVRVFLSQPNHERYTLGRSNAHTSIINQHWFNNNEIQFLIPEKFKITEKIKARRKKPSLQTNLPESEQDIQRLLDTIDKKLTMLTNTPVKNEDTDQKFSELRVRSANCLNRAIIKTRDYSA